MSEEQVLLKVNPAMGRGAPFSFALCCLVVVGAAVGLVALIVTGREAPVTFALGCLLAGAAALGLIILFIWWLRCRATELTVTTRRTTLRHGLLSKTTTEVRHQDVRVLTVTQTLLQRLTNTGSIAIGSSGEAGVEITATGLPGPQRIADLIRQRQT